MRHPLQIALALFAAASPTFARAAPAQAPAPSVAIRYADLDLGDARDAAVMLHRIRKAATEACSQFSGHGASDLEAFDTCHRTAVADAVAKLDARRVTAAYEETRPSSRILARLP